LAVEETAPPSGGKGVGEECDTSGSTAIFSGTCQEGLMCYQPPGASFGAPKYCVQVCNTDYTSSDGAETACASGASCSCNVPTPCTPWKGDKGLEGGCYSFCSNTGSDEKCFWPQIPFGPTPATTPAPTPAPAPGPVPVCFGFPYVDNNCGNGAYGCYPDQGCERRSMPGCGAGSSPEVCRYCAKPGGLNTAGYEECPTEPVSLGAAPAVEDGVESR